MATKYGLKFIGPITKPVDIAKISDLLSHSGPLQKTAKHTACELFSQSDLVSALVNRDITAHFQPKICTRTGQLAGAEALARWDHPDIGFIPPATFIPFAENDGLIQVVTASILRDSLSALSHWSRQFPAMKMAVNLSGAVLVDPDLPEQLEASCRKNGVDPAQVILEITESRVLSDNAMPLEVLARLRMKRFELSVDDFGTGYSNIDRLKEFPFTELKIDRSYIRNAGSDPFADKCVRASVDLGRSLGLRLVAEGVESEEDYRYAKSLDIDLIQGYYFSKALAYDEFVQKYFAQTANVA